MILTADSENFGAIQRILEGSTDGVHTLDLRAGDMQIFSPLDRHGRTAGCDHRLPDEIDDGCRAGVQKAKE